MHNTGRMSRGRLWLLAIVVLLQASLARSYEHIIRLDASDDLQYQLQNAFIGAKPDTLIELPAGTFKFDDEVVLDVSHVTVRGQGMDKTILSFKDQPAGAQGMLVLADAFTIEDLAIEDTAGDGLRMEGANGITVRRVRVEWTNRPDEENGAYGLYPVLSQNVLIEDSVVKGASDAGIYVGQSRNIIVRRNVAEYNVAGIEIENSLYADVYQNVARHNTGGILIFDLPGLSQAGAYSRVYDNDIYENNTGNFAPAGNIVGSVPAGTGVMVMATDHVEIFNNRITSNRTTGVIITSYVAISVINNLPIPDGYDPFPEFINIHDNRINRPKVPYYDGSDVNLLINILHMNSFKVVGDAIIDGLFATSREAAGICYRKNYRDKLKIIPSDFSNMQLANNNNWYNDALGIPGGPVDKNQKPFNCQQPALAEVTLQPWPPVPAPGEDGYTEEEIAALCSSTGTGVNWAAAVVDCPSLSDYRLFADASDPTTNSNGGFPYDLTTPLFSDYTNKYRFIFLPPGTQAQYAETGPLTFPLGTIITKTFTIPANAAQPGVNENVIETRLLIRREDGWERLPYIWEKDMSNAYLALGGGREMVTFVDLEGETVTTSYGVPNANQCSSCHGNKGQDLPVGPKASLLNKAYTYAQQLGLNGSMNQLDAMASLGLLAGSPGSAAAPKTPVWNDPTTGSLEARAKAYLDVNCAHCHGGGGRAFGTGLLLNEFLPVDRTYGLCKSPVAAGRGSGGLSYDIAPGDPDNSILVYRMASNDPAIRMPELGRSTVHKEGLALVREWISSLNGTCEAPQPQAMLTGNP